MARFIAQWFRTRGMLYLELGERRAAWREICRAIGVQRRVQLRDGVSVALMLLPLAWQRVALARLRSARTKAQT